MAEQLVETMTDSFDPGRYKDEYREALMSVIQAKIDGVEVTQPEPVAESANLVDLMKLLQASVKAATDEKAKGTTAPVSVADAKKARAARGAKGRTGSSAAKTTAADEGGTEPKPARRRKAS